MTAVRWGGTPYRSGVLAFVLGMAAVLGYFGPLGYAALGALGGLLLAPVTLKRVRPPLEWLALLALAVWAAVTMAWSPITSQLGFDGYGDLEQLTAAKLFLQLLLFGLLVGGVTDASVQGSRQALWIYAVMLAFWSAALLVDGLTGGGLWAFLAGLVGQEPAIQFQEKKAAEGAYVLAVLVWPAFGFLMSRGLKPIGVMLLVGLLVGAAGLSAWSAVAAVFAGGAAWLLVRQFEGAGAAVIGAAAALALVVTPMLVLEANRAGLLAQLHASLPPSWAARTDIWSYAADRVAEQPFLGRGLDASRTFGLNIPLHTHNAPLQLWLELGLPGVAAAAAFWLLLARRIARQTRRNYEGACAAAAATTAYFTVGALSFGVWQEWWLAAGAIAFSSCVAYAKIRAEDALEVERLGFDRL